ncbi:MAG: porphobilinogen synthase, partial [Burkholderiales bacterium]|nr:porphobilinogen synthase [Phycisphaerae bacterium]
MEPTRLRRLRHHPQLRHMLQRVHLRRSDIIVPVFVTAGRSVKNEVTSMPGVHQMSVDVAADWLDEMAAAGFGAYIVFG